MYDLIISPVLALFILEIIKVFQFLFYNLKHISNHFLNVKFSFLILKLLIIK